VNITRPVNAIKDVQKAADHLQVGCHRLQDALNDLRGHRDDVARRVESLLLPLANHLDEIAVRVRAITLLLEGVEEGAPEKGRDAKSPKQGKELMWGQVRKFFHAAGTRLTNPIIDTQQAIKRLKDIRRARGHGRDAPLGQGQRSQPERSGASRQDKMTERADRLLDNLKRQRDEADALAQEAKEIEKSEKKSGSSEP
jgi:hypothetical protein